MSYKVAKIPINTIQDIQIYVTKCKKTMAQVKAETGADYILNGGMWNPNLTACPVLKVNKVNYAVDWHSYGIGWNNNNPTSLSSNLYYENFDNFIACTPLVQDKTKIQKLSYGTAQGGTRGRTAIGLGSNCLYLYCSQDGTSDAKSPEKLRDWCFNQGWENATMLDSGGSSMCNFKGSCLYGDRRKVHNWILVYLKKDTTTIPTPNEPTGGNENPVTKTDTGLKIIQNYITLNPCYTNQIKCNKTKMMLHSTGTPGADKESFRNNMNKASADTSVEFVLDEYGILQLLPLGIKSWHCGASANNTHIAVEVCELAPTRFLDANWYPLSRNGKNNTTYAVMALQKELQAWGFDPNGVDGNFGPGCETAVKAFQKANGLGVDGSVGPATLRKFQTRNKSWLSYDTYSSETKPYFENVYKKAVWLFATILKQIGGSADQIVCHKEGYTQGIASNHADVLHWFPKEGKTMADFRADVAKEMNGNIPTTPVEPPSATIEDADLWAKEAWEKAYKKGVMDGTRPKQTITRQEVAVVLDNLGLLN